MPTMIWSPRVQQTSLLTNQRIYKNVFDRNRRLLNWRAYVTQFAQRHQVSLTSQTFIFAFYRNFKRWDTKHVQVKNKQMRNSILLLQLSRFAVRKVFPCVSYFFFPSSWEQEYCIEKRLCKFEAVGREFVTFSRHYSCF